MSNLTSPPVGSGGACGLHGVYDGRVCPKCAERKAKAVLDRAVWEASQFMALPEITEYVAEVLREIENDR